MTAQRWVESGRTLTFLAILFAVASPVAAATLPSGFSESLVASGLASPTAMQFAPDGRLFVCEQSGQLRVIKNGVLLPTPFVSLSVNSSGERGLLGVAFDPDFATNHYVYVYYTTATSPVHNRISRFTANGDVAVPGSEFVLLDLNNLSATNHNGGALNFGPDGKLYAAVGENAVRANAQSMNNLLGKMLRLNTDGTIPTDNPFFSTAAGQNRAIWALGLRNPFTFAFQPVGGQMFINDVGEVTWEEINDGLAGVNYGWPDTEGMTTDPRFQSPRYAYNHSGACAITGGAFYAPPTTQFPASYVGDYFFADFCGGWIRKLDPANGNSVVDFASGIANPVDLKVAADGTLYYLARGSGGVVYRIFNTGAPGPTINFTGAPLTIASGQSSTLTWSTINATTVSINQGIGSVATSGNQIVSPNSTTTYTLTATGAGGTLTANVTVTVTVTPPPTILWRHSSGTVYLWSMNGTEILGGGQVGTADPAWQIVGSGDYNGDGHPDILWQHSSGTVYLWSMNGTEILGGGQVGTADPTWQIAGSGDYNGDSRADILWRHSSGTTYLWLMNGTQILAGAQVGTVDPTWQIAGSGDYNGDGRADILWRHSSGTTYLWLMNGTEILVGGPVGTDVDSTWQIAGSGDHNGDGPADILWRHTSGTTYLWLMNGTQILVGAQVDTVDPAWQIVGSGDYDGDGHADILWRHSSGTTYLWLMDGTEIIGAGQLGTVDPAWQVVSPR